MSPSRETNFVYKAPRYWFWLFYVRWERRYYRSQGLFIGTKRILKGNGDPPEVKIA